MRTAENELEYVMSDAELTVASALHSAVVNKSYENLHDLHQTAYSQGSLARQARDEWKASTGKGATMVGWAIRIGPNTTTLDVVGHDREARLVHVVVAL